ncbi:uncharacterized protein LOC118462714 [Anopheles albimanus]|uniref:uncharacterized protein LOC118462714 n=1 Tax=Anopheles albimanus TaxID=7167 RepID=UPI00163ECF50|nr:uncharacterized protein LOC118462714 [Anopheles albimanus]
MNGGGLPTKLNPADDATKWTRSPDLTASSRWFRGPQFLWEGEEKWSGPPAEKPETEAELRPAFTGPHSTATAPMQPGVLDVVRFSSWTKLLRVIGIARRFFHNCKARRTGEAKVQGTITTEEIDDAQRIVIAQVHKEEFPSKIKLLTSAKTSTARITVIPKNSPIYLLSPILDESEREARRATMPWKRRRGR